MRIRICARAALLVILIACVPAGDALAHVFPSSERPAAGSTLRQCPAEVSIGFDAPVESLFAKIQVVNEAGQVQTGGEPRVSADRKSLSIPLKHLPPGDYTVKWSVVAQDGHRSEGSFSFTIADPGS